MAVCTPSLNALKGFRKCVEPVDPPMHERLIAETAADELLTAVIAFALLLSCLAYVKQRSFSYALLGAYFAVGTVVYKELEGWRSLDAIYFMVVTSTTVGYGDLCPSTPEGRLFTCVYALLGTTMIVDALAPLVDVAMAPFIAIAQRLLPVKSDVTSKNLPLGTAVSTISYPRRYARACNRL